MSEKTLKRKKDRIIELDFIRGVLIWFMIVDHFFFDIAQLVGDLFKRPFPTSLENFITFANNYWSWDVRIVTRFIILSLFFLISGICCYLSRSNLHRGLSITAVGLAISVVFCFYGKFVYTKTHGSPDTSAYIIFGAISCFGLSILIFSFVRMLFNSICKNHKEDFKWLALGLGMIIIAFGIMFGVWNVNKDGSFGPARIYLSGDSTEFRETLGKYIFKFIIGVNQPNSADWLPLCPYLGFMFIGAFIGEFVYKDRKSLFTIKLPTKPEPGSEIKRIVFYDGVIIPYKGIKSLFSFTGRHSLIFYIAHQIVLVVLISLVLLMMGLKLNI